MFLAAILQYSKTKSMFRNYFKTSWRNIIKEKGYSGFNILGLAIGMAVALAVPGFLCRGAFPMVAICRAVGLPALSRLVQ